MVDNTGHGYLSSENRILFVPQFEERLVGDGDCMEIWWDNSTVKSELFLLQMTVMNTKYKNCKLIF